MKFHKRPVENQEIAFAMAVMACNGGSCNCSSLGPCDCPPIPTHQIQYDQSSSGKTTEGLQAAAEGLLDLYQ